MAVQRLRGIQSNRERIARAVAEAVHEVGPHRLTVAKILERSGISRSAFYGSFENSADALAFSWKLGRQSFASLFDQAAEGQAWRPRVGLAITALVAQAEAEPYLLELYLVHGRSTRPVLATSADSPVRALAALLRPDGTARSDLAPSPEEFIALGILSVVAERLRRGERGLWTELGPELTELATVVLNPS